MSDPDEQLTQVSEDDAIVIGPVPRRLVHGNPALIHRAAHVLVVNGDGALLLQKRSRHKDTQPGKWDTSVGGHVGFGQSYEEAARRESEEELGLRPEILEFLYATRIRNAWESENIWTYLCRNAGPFVPNPDEIESVRFWNRAEILSALGSGTFTPNFEEEFAAFTASRWGYLLK